MKKNDAEKFNLVKVPFLGANCFKMGPFDKSVQILLRRMAEEAEEGWWWWWGWGGI